MISVKVTYSNGDSLTTSINTDIKGAKGYYLNKWFNLGSVDDNMQKAVKVEKIGMTVEETRQHLLKCQNEGV